MYDGLTGIPASYGWNECTGDYQFKYIADEAAPYNHGVWPYRPLFKVTAQLDSNLTRLAFPCEGCCVSQYGSNQRCIGPLSSQTLPLWRWDGMMHPDIIQLPVEVRKRMKGNLEKQLPSISAGMPDLFVFLAELADIRDTGKWLKEKTLAKKRAGAHLEANFSIKPFIADMKAIYQHARRWRRRLRGVRDGIGKVHDTVVRLTWRSENYSLEGDPLNEHAPNCYVAACPLRNSKTHTEMWSSEEWEAKFLVKYRYSWPEEAYLKENEFVAWLAANRFIPTVESLWEMVPFSFVVDWILNTDRWLDKVGNTVGFWDVISAIVDCCLVLRCKREVTVERFHKLAPGGRLNYCQTEDYTYRWTGLNALSHLDWDVKLPTRQQLALGRSLVTVLMH